MRIATPEEMRAVDRRAVEEYGMPSLLLMENAGRAAADRAVALLRETGARTVLVLCGRGNNGGDGFVAARHLWNRGVPVRCCLFGDPEELQGDPLVNFDLLRRLGVPVSPPPMDPASPARETLVIDALVGTGFRGELTGALAEAVEALTRAGGPVLAVDVPSGLNAETGQVAGPCVRATETITFGAPKVGLVTHPGREFRGNLTVAHISLPRPLLAELPVEWVTAERAAPLWPVRPPGAHKGDAGRLFLLAGSPGMTGAAVLAAQGALRAGAGLVTVGVPLGLNPILEVKLTEAMTVPLPETAFGCLGLPALEVVRDRLRAAGACAVGPGLGQSSETGDLLRELLAECGLPMVLDADALNLLAPAGAGTFPPQAILTPHPGEMARLLGTSVETVQSNRLDTARRAAERFGCTVVLKGPASVVASPDGRVAINSSGHAALATGGTGDVLTGVIAAVLARGVSGFEAAVAGVFLHGAAGEIAGARLGAPGAVAGDVVFALPEAIRRLQTGEIPEPYRTV
jgi:ADP-dependent NAD(P)H-hydrate dehydratase / NAD(P)H-hydrate epimerase